jgi:exodeoxyribonuclease-3
VRIATWNVNSLNARLDAVQAWLERAAPDVLLLQETKLADDDVPEMAFRMAGYELLHHGEGRWNGVAIASRVGLEGPVVMNFGAGPVRDSRRAASAEAEAEAFDPFVEARMVSAVTGGIRVVSLYAPNGRQLDSAWYEGKLRWFERLADWLQSSADPGEGIVLGGDLNVTPCDDDVWDAARAHGSTHVSAPERAALARLREWGLRDLYRLRQPATDRFSWYDYRAGMFHRNEGMRIDLLYGSQPVADRVVWAEIDREARKGPPTPSDHAPVVVDLDEPGRPFEAGWDAALARISQRSKPRPS